MSIHDTWMLPPQQADSPLPGVITPAIRSILLRRGVRTEEEYRRFVDPCLDDLHDPSLIGGMDSACERILKAIRELEPILIYGDYDVDGVTSIVLLKTVLRTLGARVDFVVPHRLYDGYGLKMEVLERVLVDRQVRLVITVDCGITSVEPVEKALARGIDVIITDHHLPPGLLPEAAAVLNPKVEGCLYPFKELAGVGVAFKLCCELLKRTGRPMSIESLLKIAAIGTIADVAPLTGENRTIVRMGLQGLAESRNVGLRTLLRTLGLYGRPLRAVDVGFKIGPRINAAGRLASADTAIELFAASSEAEAYPLVGELNRLNEERRGIESEILHSAELQIEGKPLPPALVLAGEGWHKGVLGLCAGRLAQKYHRPTLLISLGEEQCVGSGRSIPSVNLHRCLERMHELFTHFGGHEFACGFSLRRENVDSLRERLQKDLSETVFERTIEVDATITLADLTSEFLFDHSRLEPFGAGNLQPVFGIEGVRTIAIREFAQGCFNADITDGVCAVRCVLWPSSRTLLDVFRSEEPFSILAHLEPDTFLASGFRLEVLDARIPEG